MKCQVNKFITLSEMKDDLADYRSWVRANPSKSFSFFDYIHAKINFDNVSADLGVAVMSLCWPSFKQVEDCIFLAENLTPERHLAFNTSRLSDAELFINLVNVSELFPSLSLDIQNSFAAQLAKVWKVKLSLDFPEKVFSVKNFVDGGSVYCAFHQSGGGRKS